MKCHTLSYTWSIAVGKAVVRKFDASMLAENNGLLSLTTNWAKSFLYRMNFVKRKICLTAKLTIHSFEAIKTDFLCDVLADGRHTR